VASPRLVIEYDGIEKAVRAVEARASKDWLRYTYSKMLFGGWERDDGKWVDQVHVPALKFHEACKMLFCPACRTCGREPKSCKCDKIVPCYNYIGQAGKDESDTFECPQHGAVPFRRCLYKGSVFMLTGNQLGKTTAVMSEYTAWIKGRRPWDDTLTAPRGSGRIWGYACKSLTKSAALVLCPEFEMRMRDNIEKKVENSQKAISHYILRDPPGDAVHFMSYEQYKNAGAFGVNPYEGPRFYSFAWDEPMPAGARSAVLRGLVAARSKGWGREAGAMTPLRSLYVLRQIQDEAWNLGGSQKHLHVVGGTIHDNHSLTDTAKEEIMSSWDPSEREARETGFCLHLSGRVFPEFDEEVHVYEDGIHDVLSELEPDRHPSDASIACICDPHTRRPWVFIWVAIDKNDEWWVIREWPTSPFERMREGRYTFDDYAAIIGRVESSIPGGRERVLWREMDPSFGRSTAAGSGYDTIQRAMRERGYAFRADVDNDIEQGHQALRQLLWWDETKELSELNHPRLHVAESCRNVIWAFNNYVHDEWADMERSPREKPKDAGKDHVDCLRYFAMRRARFLPWKERHGMLERQVQRIAKSMRGH
jgi:hypothetical protein